MKTKIPVSTSFSGKVLFIKVLLSCGIISSLLYVCTDIFAARQWEEYSSASQTVSELIAIDAPTRPLVVPFFIAYSLLVYAFGLGIWEKASPAHPLRYTGIMLITKEVLGLVITLFFPIHQRGIEGTLTDILHAVFTGMGVLFILLAMGFGAMADGKWFRLYTVITILVLILFGVSAGMDGSRIAVQLPTPLLGVKERITIYGFLLWVIVLSIILLRSEKLSVSDKREQQVV